MIIIYFSSHMWGEKDLVDEIENDSTLVYSLYLIVIGMIKLWVTFANDATYYNNKQDDDDQNPNHNKLN